MASKLPPMMRPVDTFIYRTKDSAPAICLISNGYTRRELPQRKEKKDVRQPKATKFPRALLGSLKTEVRANTPLISPAKRERVGVSTLRYPKAKEPLPGPLTALDQFTVKDGKVKRIPTSTFDFETSETEEDNIAPYRSRVNVKPDLKPIVELSKCNQELQKRLKSLTTSIESLNGGAPSQSTAPESFPTKPNTDRSFSTRQLSQRTVKPNLNLVDHNRQLLYNVRSAEPIPRKDAKWIKEIRKSPMRVRAPEWVEDDPVLMRRTITGGSLKRLYLSEGEECRTRSSLVMARYPFCHTCVVHSSPIRVSLERS